MAVQNQEKKRFDYEGEIWKIANFVWGPIKTSEFNRVILPFTMLRRLECALEPTRNDVIKAVEEHEKEWGNESKNYCQFSQMAFYNTTAFRLNSLGATDTLEALNAYIDGFSPNAREIMKKFKMEETCKTLQSHGMLYSVCTQFAAFDLSPKTVSDREMSNIYEHLIEKFGESIAENAEDFMTPKDIVRLATSMVFAGDDEIMNGDSGIVRTLYDSCLGTGGFITDALDQLEEWHCDKKMKAPARIVPYGEEVEPESWAMAKAALLLRNISGDGADIYDKTKDRSENIMYGNTLTDDKFPDDRFDYILTNPPYGKPYKVEQADILDEARNGFLGRFGAGLPSVDDSSMLFLQNVVKKLKKPEEGGGKAAIILSGSPLFTGDAGSGPSNIRRWLFKEDVIDCIVKLGDQEFFRTGINTYLWCLSTKKPESRKGKIQLIDASEMKTLLKKNMGNKRYEVSEADRDWIVKTYIDGEVNDKSVIVSVEDFMFRKVTTQRPLRMKIKVTEDSEKMAALREATGVSKLSDSNFKVLYDLLLQKKEVLMPYGWADEVAKTARKAMEKPEATASNISNAIISAYGIKDSSFEPVLNKDGSIMPDPDLKDTENIPFGISFDDYMKTEVLPYAEDAWIDETVIDKGPLADGGIGVVGTNISFNRYFYHYEIPRDPEEIAREILDIENGLESFMEGFLK